ncbi:hypothetical protein AAG906_008156 [Vitis piasezkii]
MKMMVPQIIELVGVQVMLHKKEILIPSGGNRGVGGTGEGTGGNGSIGSGYASQVDPSMSWAQGDENYYATQDTDHGYRPGIWD